MKFLVEKIVNYALFQTIQKISHWLGEDFSNIF